MAPMRQFKAKILLLGSFDSDKSYDGSIADPFMVSKVFARLTQSLRPNTEYWCSFFAIEISAFFSFFFS